MKKIVISLAVLFAFISCEKAVYKKDNDLEKEKLFGKIKKLIVNKFEVNDNFGEIQIVGYINEGINYFEYNKLGFITKSGLEYGNLISDYSIYSYDSNNNLLQIKSFDYSNNKEKTKYTYTYDEKGFLLNHEIYFSDKLFRGCNYINDKNGNCIEENNYPIEDLTTYEYPRIINKYNESNKRVERIGYSTDEKILFKVLSEYDTLGNDIKTEFLNTGRPNSISTMMYDNKNRLINEIHVSNEVINLKEYYNYDSSDNIIEKKSVEIDSDIETESFINYRYEIDHKGNWVKKYIYYDRILSVLEERKIEYYD